MLLLSFPSQTKESRKVTVVFSKTIFFPFDINIVCFCTLVLWVSFVAILKVIVSLFPSAFGLNAEVLARIEKVASSSMSSKCSEKIFD